MVESMVEYSLITFICLEVIFNWWVWITFCNLSVWKKKKKKPNSIAGEIDWQYHLVAIPNPLLTWWWSVEGIHGLSLLARTPAQSQVIAEPKSVCGNHPHPHHCIVVFFMVPTLALPSSCVCIPSSTAAASLTSPIPIPIRCSDLKFAHKPYSHGWKSAAGIILLRQVD